MNILMFLFQSSVRYNLNIYFNFRLLNMIENLKILLEKSKKIQKIYDYYLHKVKIGQICLTRFKTLY